MINRRRTARINQSVFGCAAAVVIISVSFAILDSNFQDVWSFSTNAPICLSSRQLRTNYDCDNERTNPFRILGIGQIENLPRTRITNIGSQNSNRQSNNNNKYNNNNNKYKDRQEQQQRERQRRELQNKIHRARDSILYYGQDSGTLPSIELRSGILPKIVQSYTEAMFESTSTNLFDPWDSKSLILTEPRPVQERVLGLLAVLIQVITHIQEESTLYKPTNYDNDDDNLIQGIQLVQSRLWETSRDVLRDMAESDNPHVVSPMAITALAKALREANSNSNRGRSEILELMQLVDAASKHTGQTNESLDMAMESAWNIYLASLCDRALTTNNPSDAGLETAAKLVMQNNNGMVDSNVISYNTVMNVAAKVGNATLVNTMWKDLSAKRQEQPNKSLQPNSRTYNTRLMVTTDETERLQILDKEIIPEAFQLQRENATVSASPESSSVIDSFTIDMMMMPLLKANRKKHLFQLIDHWMTLVNRQHNVNGNAEKGNKAKAQRAFKNAMAAFFITLVQDNGDVRTARELWNRYMVLSIDNLNEGNNRNTEAFLRATNIVSPERRHYNILLDGYARLVDQVRDRQAREQFRILDDDSFSKNGKVKKKIKIWEASAASKSEDENNEPEATSTTDFYEEVQEKAIRDGQELFALMMAEQQRQNSRNKVGPDAYTKSTMIRLCRSGTEVQNLLQKTSIAASNRNTDQKWLPRAVTRAAVTTCGRLGDPSMSCVIFDQFMFPEFDLNHFSNYRAFNVLLGALAVGAKLDNPRLDVLDKGSIDDTKSTPSFLLSELQGLTCTEAVVRILNLMTKKNSQTYCVAASALQYAPIGERIVLSQTATDAANLDQNSTISNSNAQEATPLALQIFQNATRDGIDADGRLVNAIFRCYGDDIAGALDGWKSDIRKATYEFEQNSSNKKLSTKKNMLAAYNGLLYVCGRAERPDIAVRIVYAMKNKEGLDPSENPYNNYRSGKILRKNLVKRDKEVSSWRRVLPKIDLVGQYENILYIECKKYDTRDRRMEKDNRIRIIV